MLVQWVLSMALSAVILLGAMEGFLLLSLLYKAQVELSQEQAQVRFLVGYFRGLFLAGVIPDQPCGNLINHDHAIMPVSAEDGAILTLRVCRQVAGHAVIMPVRFFLEQFESKPGITLFIQEGTHRLEALSSVLHSFSVKYCILTAEGGECQMADKIHDWASVGAVEFYLRFNTNDSVDKIVTLRNQHRWQFSLKTGGNA